MKYLQTCDCVYFLRILLWLLLWNKKGVSHLCYSIKQNEENTVTVTFCQDGSGSGKTIFLVSGAQKYETVHSCICTFGISDAVRNISLSYNAGNAIGNCGVKITIVDESNELTCTSTDLAVQTLKTVEFSRSSIKETHFCLEISLGIQSNATINVTCTTDNRDDRINSLPVTTDDQREHLTSSSGFPGTTTDKLNTTIKKGETEKHNDITDTLKTNETSAIIGGAVGGSIAVLLTIVIVLVIFCWRKRHKSKEDSTNYPSTDDGKPKANKPDRMQEMDNKGFEKTKADDDDLVVTYNDMYNIETIQRSEKIVEQCDKEIPEGKQLANDYTVITDNAMYNVETMPLKDEQYSVPNLTDPFTVSGVGEARDSQIYHEIESGSPVATESNAEW